MRNHVKENLTKLLNQGDTAVFRSIYDEYFPEIYFFARHLIGNKEDAKDIVAETFVKLWKRRANFESPSNIKAFLYITSRNACVDYLRQTKLRLNKQQDIRNVLFLQLQGTYEDFQVDRGLSRPILQQIRKLPVKCRIILELYYLEGLNNDEIANKMSVSEKTVRNLKTKALKILRNVFLK